MDSLKGDEHILIIYSSDEKEAAAIKKKLEIVKIQVTITSFQKIADITKADYDITIVLPQVGLDNCAASVFEKLKPDGKVLVYTKSDTSQIELGLKTNGFVNVTLNKQGDDYEVTAEKPKYDVGSSVKLSLKKPAVWKLDDGGDDTIDPDNLLDEDDLKKPTAESLKVCGTTGKRKACKDCSCGLADELAAEKGEVVDTAKGPKSSCGSCYLGDAFRCASCPYLGMPAFKPGEKVQLTAGLLKDDL